MRASLTDWATLRVEGDRALVLPAPDLDTLSAGLDQALQGAWGLRYAVEQVQPPVVRASLQLGAWTRDGLGEGHTLHDARRLALADAMRAHGVPATPEGQWVEYDPEEGPNTHELEPEPAPAPHPEAAPLPPAPPRDPQLERARTHIDDLLETLRAAGMGAQAARVLSRRGYGNTVEESREVYKELKALKG
ncbi:single-stranded DNA-binding protein [Deinococcus aquiradiocola]|uniref:Uncharacterized protein n=1 Tax=Deinococcus aquiradiocola TaxID=393059 RepID=A0A917PQ67_9DEIO|nr:single-stranded DNA-binding protein [Deinococcus aquiradiocola]GGJ86830.1 hypothetical protein GCM10008939_33510 [Deinococcus aquiradiocola]